MEPRKDFKQIERVLKKQRFASVDCMARKQKELNKAILAHSFEFYKFHRLRKAEVSRLGRAARDFIVMSIRKKEKNKEMAERARINSLKVNDMDGYTSLVEETRNKRLKFLMDKTEECMNQISGLLQDKHRETNGKAHKDNVDLSIAKSNAMDATSSYYISAHVKEEVVRQPSLLSGGKLKDYQIGGLQWLVSLYNNKLNGILADEMGLGKTVQTIALIAYLIEYKDNGGPYLVIVPLSTLSNWVNEFRRWCPTATVVVYKGTPAQRKALYRDEIREGHFNVLLTTYEYIIRDKACLRKLPWQYAIVDEGHRMKNAQSKFAVILGTQYTTKHRVLLTGTPLQNSLPELWALLNFLLPTIFNSVETFDQWFNKPFAQFGGVEKDSDGESINNEERMLIIRRLHELLRPFMLRRVKTEVLDQLPDKVEKVIRCELSSWQKALYKQISQNIIDEHGKKSSQRGLNNIVMQLRKVCNHPYMFSPEGYYINDNLIRTSGKVELLDRMLPKLKAAGHRILMFFQMTGAMTILEDYCKYRNYSALRLDGSTTGDEREKRMELFNATDSPYFIFMLSTRAGGLGLNLASADTVIIFDSDWNPMMDLQAQDRAHRIGQKKIVSVYRLISNSPVEEKILSRATEKLNMSELIVEAGRFNKSNDDNDNSEERTKMMELLLTDFDTNTASNGKSNATRDLPSSDDERDENGYGDHDEGEIGLIESMSRNDEDYELYSKIESGEIVPDEYYSSPGLITDPDDVPDWIRYPKGKKEEESENDGNDKLELTKRRTANQAKSYSDGLTERQFVKLMEDTAQEEEENSKKRKSEWHEKRAKKVKCELSSKSSLMDKTVSSPEQLDRSDLHLIVEKSNILATVNPTPPPNSLSEVTNNRLVSICKGVIALRDIKSKRRISDVFREKPCVKTYPDYYKKIKDPIAINDIVRKTRAKSYSTVIDFADDWNLMFSNAKSYNGEQSWIVDDARALEIELERLMEKSDLYKIFTNTKKPLRIKLSLKNMKKQPVSITDSST